MISMRKAVLSLMGPAALLGTAAIYYARADALRESHDLRPCRHRMADGNTLSQIDISAVSDRYALLEKRVADNLQAGRPRVRNARMEAHHSGLLACRREASRRIRLSEQVPTRYRTLTTYFVTVPPGGTRPGILPRSIPRDAVVFALDVQRAADIARLAKTLNRPITLATASFAQAMGVTCSNAQVGISDDGYWATVREAPP